MCDLERLASRLSTAAASGCASEQDGALPLVARQTCRAFEFPGSFGVPTQLS
jgi:hypothetical protein